MSIGNYCLLFSKNDYFFSGFDNTLHVVSALTVVDKSFQSNLSQSPFSLNQITSYIIPFVGPHECPNSKSCPNHSTDNNPVQNKTDELESKTKVMDVEAELKPQKSLDSEEKSKAEDDNSDEGVVLIQTELNPIEEYTTEIPDNMLADAISPNVIVDKTGNSQVMASSFMYSATCPYPLSVVWWQTMDSINRAIIGYSDGSICFVGLSPNCPFVASTSINSGSVVKLLICRDNTFESVMMLVSK